MYDTSGNPFSSKIPTSIKKLYFLRHTRQVGPVISESITTFCSNKTAHACAQSLTKSCLESKMDKVKVWVFSSFGMPSYLEFPTLFVLSLLF